MPNTFTQQQKVEIRSAWARIKSKARSQEFVEFGDFVVHGCTFFTVQGRTDATRFTMYMMGPGDTQSRGWQGRSVRAFTDLEDFLSTGEIRRPTTPGGTSREEETAETSDEETAAVVTHIKVCGKYEIPCEDFAKGTIVIGDTGSGKTHLLKHIVESAIEQQHSLKHVVMIDWKGDLSQMVQANEDHADYKALDDAIDVRVYSLGADTGIDSTLDPFYMLHGLLGLDLSRKGNNVKLIEALKSCATDILSGNVSLDKFGDPRLSGAYDMPLRKEMSTLHGLQAADSKVIASKLIDVLSKVLYKCATVPDEQQGRWTCPRRFLPKTFPELLREVKQAGEDHCGTEGDRFAAKGVTLGPVNQLDLDAVAHEIETRMEPSTGFNMLYESPKKCTVDGSGDVVALSADTLLNATPRQGKRCVMSIINLALMGTGPFGTKARPLAAATMLRRLEAFVAKGGIVGGDEKTLAAMVVIDEAAVAMPNMGKTAIGDAVATTVAVENMVRLHRDKGLGVVLATQRPGDLHSTVRSIVTGPRFIGRFQAGKAEEEKVFDSLIPIKKLRDPVRQQFRTLQRNSFIGFWSDDKMRVMKAPALKRVHESSSKWVADEHADHPLVKHHDEPRKRLRVAERGQQLRLRMAEGGQA